MLIIFRVLFFVFLIGTSLLVRFLLRKKGFVRKKAFKISSAILILVFLSLSLFPVENLFVTFPTPESVLHYTGISGEVERVIYGNDSYLVFYTGRTGTRESFFARRSDDGYKLPGDFFPRRTIYGSNNGWFFESYRVPNTSDFYINGSLLSEESYFFILDGNGDEIEQLFLRVDTMGTELYIVSFWMFVEGFTDDFALLINGERVYVAG